MAAIGLRFTVRNSPTLPALSVHGNYITPNPVALAFAFTTIHAQRWACVSRSWHELQHPASQAFQAPALAVEKPYKQRFCGKYGVIFFQSLFSESRATQLKCAALS